MSQAPPQAPSMHDLPDDQWDRMQSLFSQVADLPTAERAGFLDHACAGDDSLRQRINLLLENDRHEGVLDSPPTPTLASTPGAPAMEVSGATVRSLIGSTIGRYKLVRIIASGGMGTVYESQQDQPRRMVALKLMHRSSASRSMVRRFQAEADILGRLQHQAIAQIHDAGVFESDDGPQPYFAMELIDGDLVTTFAEKKELGIRDRLALLEKICRGVEYAHSQGVIHRDLKPANILVDRAGQPKILDFGIARATAADQQHTTIQTGVGQLLGTLPYMSPEQVSSADDTGESNKTPIDARSDVYALGVIAYELLTGRLPHDVQSSSLAEAVRVIREEDPTPLSSVNRIFRGDLDTIIAKALEKDRARRYQSAGALADDINRYLADEPVLARRASAMYQLRKFARRNKTLVGGLAAVFVALVLGVIGTSWQWARATHQRNEAEKARTIATTRLEETRQLLWAMMEYADKDLAKIPGGTPARERLMREAVQRFSTMAATDDPGLLSRTIAYGLGYAHQRLGEVQLVMGRSREALASFEAALRVRQRQADAMPDQQDFVRPLVVGHWKVAEALVVLGRIDEAQQHNLTSLELLQSVQAKQPNPSTGHYFGAARRRIAELEAASGRHTDAVEHYRHSVRDFEAMLAFDPDNTTTREGLAIAYRGLGETLAALGEPQRALESINQSLQVIQHLADRSGAANVPDRTLRAETLIAKARVLISMNNHDEAAQGAREAVSITESLTQADAENYESRHLLSRALAVLADAMPDDGETEQASPRRRAIELLRSLAQHDSDNAIVRRELEALVPNSQRSNN